MIDYIIIIIIILGWLMMVFIVSYALLAALFPFLFALPVLRLSI